MLSHTTWLVAKTDPIKYILEKPALTSRIAQWQMALSEYDIIYVNRNAIKGSALAEHLTYHPLIDPQPLYHEFPDEHIMAATKIEPQYENERTMVYRDSALVIYQLRGEWGTWDVKLILYHVHVKEIIGAFDAISFHYVPREENQMADALATLSAMVQVNEGQEITIHVRQQPRVAYCQYLGQEIVEISPEP
ncbi:hypothetical protein CR513_02560, partial [Mucuna pruriens]